MDNTTVVLRVLHPPFLRRFNQHLALVSSGSFGANSGFFVDVDGHLKPTRTSTFKADPDDPSKLSICQGISLVPTDHASNLWQLHFPDEYYNHVAALDAVRALNDPNLVPTSEDEAELADSVNNRFADNETYKKTIKKLKAKHPSIYPARLMNLPTVVELHKSFNTHKEYVKANDVGQILVVYGNVRHMNELEEGKFKPLKQFPGYWRDGVLSSSDVMKDIVGERYAKRAHDRRDFIPSIDECRRVEGEMIDIVKVATNDMDDKKGNRGGNFKKAMSHPIIEVEEVVVDYEPWMDQNGRQKGGVEISEGSNVESLHPELWFKPERL